MSPFVNNRRHVPVCIDLPFRRIYWLPRRFSRPLQALHFRKVCQPRSTEEWDCSREVLKLFCSWKTLLLKVSRSCWGLRHDLSLLMLMLMLMMMYCCQRTTFLPYFNTFRRQTKDGSVFLWELLKLFFPLFITTIRKALI